MKSNFFVELRPDFFVKVSKRRFQGYLDFSVRYGEIICFYSDGVLYHQLKLNSSFTQL